MNLVRNVGEVTEENRAKIADRLKYILGGSAREVVDRYIDGDEALHTDERRMTLEDAGSEETYTAMVAWAKAALTKEEVAAYNKAVNSGSRHAQQLAIRSLRVRYQAESLQGDEG